MDLYQKMRRARRRDRMLVIAKRRRDEHLARMHFDATTGLTQVDCPCELSNTMFAKRSAHGCGCRKRTKGRPKVANGMCKIGARDHIIKLRQEDRQLRGGDYEAREIRWPSTKSGPKPYTIEKRSISRKGVPGQWWSEVKSYRTEQSREDALAALRKSVGSFGPRHNDEDAYRGPRQEYRAGPDKT